jgi:uncharacterized protein with GYD domain
MTHYVVLADVNEQEFQNAQDFVTVWGNVRDDIREIGGELIDTYALLGGYDFLVTFDVPDEQLAMEIALAIERHGLDTETMQAMPVDRFGELVDDV